MVFVFGFYLPSFLVAGRFVRFELRFAGGGGGGWVGVLMTSNAPVPGANEYI
jgi:hypothetical protein